MLTAVAIVATVTYLVANFAGNIRWRTVTRTAGAVAMSLFGWIVARLHLLLFDPLFLRIGSIERFRRVDDA
jgi:uncharacterized membrane protein YphA (DoxX/SURF4 family)